MTRPVQWCGGMGVSDRWVRGSLIGGVAAQSSPMPVTGGKAGLSGGSITFGSSAGLADSRGIQVALQCRTAVA